MLKAKEEFEKLGTQIDIALKAGKKLEEQLSQEQLTALKKYRDALTYYQFVLKRRDSKYITAVLKEVKPMIEIDPKELNGNEFLLNTPSGTLDLRKGVSSLREHDPHDYITKCTTVSPSDKGKDLWLDCLNKIFAKDIELIDYVQQICGLAVIGKVYVEALIVAYGDGIHDDSQIIINAINGAKELNMDTLFFNSSNYLCNSKLDIGEVNELALLGNNSTIIVNDNYDDTDYKEFFLNIWNCNDFLLSDISISYDFSRAINGIKTQVGIHNSKKVEYVNSTFNIPDSTLKLQYKDREFTNFDCYQGWEDIVINNCNFINLTDSSAGGSLWIRDFRNTGSKNIKVLNSYFHKIAHDELIAVFMGSIQNVIIRNNTFKVEDSGESSSVMNFTFGSASSKLADNIVFEKNNIDVCSTGGLIWSTNATNVIIRDNIIKSSISSKTNNNFRMIESLNENTIDLIQNNHVIFSSLLKDYSFQVHIFKNIKEVLNNTVEINCKITDLFLDVNSVIDNICNIYSNVDFISYNTKEKFKSNKISFNSCKFGSFFRYYGITLNSNIDIVDNIINYTYSESSEDASYIIMANDMYMANYVINLSNNTINTLEISKNSRFLFIAPKDEEIQNFKAFNNTIGNYNSFKNDYIKNCNVER